MGNSAQWNHFASLSDTLGRENAFTAGLVSLLQGIPELKDQFISWIQPHAAQAGFEDLTREWKIRAEVYHPTVDAGAAFIDMVLSSDDLELWFEHKIDSREGVVATLGGERIGQLAKYQQARKRYEATTIDGRPSPRVLLFYVTARAEQLSKERAAPIAATGKGGFVWVKDTGGLRWSGFHALAQKVLALQASVPTKPAMMLLDQFMTFWDGIETMRQWPTEPNLHPTDPSARRGLWQPAEDWLRAVVPGGYHNYNGTNIEVRPTNGPFDYVLVQPRLPTQIRGWRFGPDILQIAVRLVEDGSELEGGHVRSSPNVMLEVERTRKGTMLRFFVELADWESRIDDVGRQTSIRDAVIIAIEEITRATGHVLREGPG